MKRLLLLSIPVVPLLFLATLLQGFPFKKKAEVFFREDFKKLVNWRRLTFPKIEKHTRYSVEKKGKESYLKAISNGSASGLVCKKEYDPNRYPKLRWRWKISNVYRKGDGTKKAGDDFPLRVYVIFKYNPKQASFGQRLKYNLAKALHGEYPPECALNYIWANRKHKKWMLVNPYSDQSLMIPLRHGPEKAGQWIEEEVDVIADYKRIFGKAPKTTVTVAIMNDSDNTGEKSTAYIDYIEVFKK